MARRFSLLLIVLSVAITAAQSYQCNWQVVAIAGGESGGTYRAGATAGQTAAGLLTGSNLLANIGFWYPDITTGIDEQEQFRKENTAFKETRLYPPAPNPFFRMTHINYTLNCEQVTSVVICDIAGRSIRTLVNSTQQPGKYTLHWDGKDNVGRLVPSGVYICRFRAGEYHQNIKLLLQR
jgi:hypothetical protein